MFACPYTPAYCAVSHVARSSKTHTREQPPLDPGLLCGRAHVSCDSQGCNNFTPPGYIDQHAVELSCPVRSLVD